MGCVNTKSQPGVVNSTPKTSSSQQPRLSQCQTQSPLDSAHKIVPDQSSMQLNSPNRDASSEFLLKSPKSVKPISHTGKKSDILPTLKLPSHDPSYQEFSFKGSPEVSFDKDKTPVSLRSPAEKDNLKLDNNVPSLARSTTPSFAKPAGLRIIASPGHNFPEIHIKDVNLWSLIPPKESQISPLHTEIKEARSEDRSSSIDKDEKDRREELELSTGTEKREIIIPQRETDKIKEELKGKLPTVIQFKTPSRKFQHILLSDNGDGLGESPPQSKGNTPIAAHGKPLIIQSPPKTLSMLDTPYIADTKKSLELPDHTILSSPSNVNSVGTISNLVNLCKDVKKKDFEKKFRTNLVSLIKDKVPDEILDSRRPDNDSQGILSSKSVHNGRGLSNNRKLTSKILSPKSAFSQNLLNFATKEDENKSQRATSENNYDNVFGDIEGPSPVSNPSPKQQNKNFVLPLQWLSTISSPQKVTDNSMLQASIYNFDDGLSKMDWERYSIQEQFNHIEIDDRSFNHTPLEASIALENPNNSQMNMSVSATEILEVKPDELNMAKSRSVPHATVAKSDEIIDLAPTRSNPPNPIERRTNNLLNESVSTLQYLSPKVVSVSHISSRNPARRMSRFTRNDSQVIETNRVDVSVDDGGQKKINQYILIKEIGRGGFGKVKLALNAETKKQHAIKIANKKKLKRKLLTRQKSAFTQLASEIAILKKMDHPNIVTLYEVIDDPNNDKLYLIMDYIKRGAVMSRNYWRQATKAKNIADDDGDDSPYVKKKMVLSEEKARKFFRHLILGLDYLHNYAEIIHRDIKPENLLVGEDDVLRISDFGISKIMEEGDDKLENNAGTQYYQPPEAWEGKSFRGKPTDIWAAGGTLYYFLVGKPPFQGMDLQRKIKEEEPQFPEDLNINPKAIALIRGCLKKKAEERLTIDEIMKDPWLTKDGTDPLQQDEEYEKLVVNDDECCKALTRVKFMAAVRVMAKLKKNLNISRRNIAKRKMSGTSEILLGDNLQSPGPQMKNSGFNLIVVGE